ncbi:MAG: PKD domain-containing protein, partial [Bacteroidales bacterium]|nr:PKD domain-containing protein [Bacteroidales bacterium]
QEIKNFVSWTPPISHRYSKPGVYEVSLFVEFYNDSNELVCTDLVKKSVIVGTNPLLASFSYTTSNDTIRFYDNSIGNIVSYNWDFGDGTTASSKNVLHKYKNDGLYTVCLTVKDQNNNINNVCKEIIVGNPLCKLKASFLSYKDSTNQLKVYFINTSLGGQQFYWDFGDGNISTVKNPSHTYAKMGAYTVSLLISDSANCYDRYVQKIYAGVINCLASFDYIANESTRTVSISNSSIAGNSAVYFWNFGDGTFSSVSNPVPKVYTKDGKYKISLLVYDPNTGCDDYIEKVVYINNPCKAIFSYYVDTTNKEIVLQNLSLNSNKYYWAFGDGTYSTLDNPVYTYHKPGIYKVALHVANSTNGCTDLSEAYIRTSPSDDCEADFVYRVNESAKQVYFYNRSLGQINKYFWNFGNGTTSTLMNPSVTYTKSGVYNVCLTVVDNKGISNITCKKVAITSNSCVADYEYLIQPDRKVIFNDRSLGTPTSYTWQFGDNSSGTGRHVEHVYTTNGYYLSSLKIQSGSTCNSIAYKLLNIGMPGRIKAALIANVSNSNNKAGGYPVDFIGAGLGDEVRIKWIFGDGTEDTTTTTPTHVYANPGTYTACYIISDPITEQSDTVCTLVTVTSISTPHYTNEIQIFPVPFGEHLNINLKIANASKLQISLTDLTGRTIRVFENRNIAAGVYNLRYNTLNIKPGTYLLRVQYGNQSSSHVVTKQ